MNFKYHDPLSLSLSLLCLKSFNQQVASKANSCYKLIVSRGQMSIRYSLNKHHPSIDKRETKLSIKVTDCDIWKVVKEGSFVTTHNFNSVVLDKSEKDWSNKDKENM